MNLNDVEKQEYSSFNYFPWKIFFDMSDKNIIFFPPLCSQFNIVFTEIKRKKRF